MRVPESSDAFVFFGATGDLAYKKIFPALQAMIRSGDLDMPIIGMARAERRGATCSRSMTSPSCSTSTIRCSTNDYVEEDLKNHLEREFRPANRDRYWKIFELICIHTVVIKTQRGRHRENG